MELGSQQELKAMQSCTCPCSSCSLTSEGRVCRLHNFARLFSQVEPKGRLEARTHKHKFEVNADFICSGRVLKQTEMTQTSLGKSEREKGISF